jgi:hypothetical protein
LGVGHAGSVAFNSDDPCRNSFTICCGFKRPNGPWIISRVFCRGYNAAISGSLSSNC